MPSAALRERVLGSEGFEAPAAVAPSGRAGLPPAFWGVAAALIVAVLGLGSYAVVQQQRVGDIEEKMETIMADASEMETKLQQQLELTAIAVQPGVSRASMRSVATPAPAAEPPLGVIFAKPSGQRVLWVVNLDKLPEGSVYQAWLWESEDEVYSMAVFEVGEDGQALVPMWLPEHFTEDSWMSVSVETVGGAIEPAGTPVLVGRIE